MFIAKYSIISYNELADINLAIRNPYKYILYITYNILYIEEVIEWFSARSK